MRTREENEDTESLISHSYYMILWERLGGGGGTTTANKWGGLELDKEFKQKQRTGGGDSKKKWARCKMIRLRKNLNKTKAKNHKHHVNMRREN